MEQNKGQGVKEDFYKKIEAQIKELDERFKTLEAKASHFKDAAKVEIDNQLKALLKKKDELMEKERQLKNTSGEAFGIMKEGLGKAASELKSALDQSIAKFK